MRSTVPCSWKNTGTTFKYSEKGCITYLSEKNQPKTDSTLICLNNDGFVPQLVSAPVAHQG